jgi:hypothetical protein
MTVHFHEMEHKKLPQRGIDKVNWLFGDFLKLKWIDHNLLTFDCHGNAGNVPLP